MVKTVILTEGGRNIGFGHLTRTISLYEEFCQKGLDVEFLIKGDEAAECYMHDKNSRLYDWIKKHDALPAMLSSFDIALVDSYLADQSVYQTISGAVKIAAFIDDFCRITYPGGVVINGSLQGEMCEYPRCEECEYLVGPKYVPIRPEFRGLAPKKIAPVISKALITCGGSDTREAACEILSIFSKRFPDMDKCVTVGKAFKAIARIEALKDARTEIVYQPPAFGMRRLMEEADIAVSTCGQTLYELAASGVPTIGVCVADNQEPNIQGWLKKGFLKYAGWFNDPALEENITGFMDKLADADERRALSCLGQKLVDGRGPERIVDHLLNKLNATKGTTHEQAFR